MGILKFALVGAAVAYGITELTKKRENGTSILDDLVENAPEWMDKAKEYAAQAVDKINSNIKPNPGYSEFDQTL
ncbi:MAG: YtxH domain-containing protein [Mucilaginibacter sp.]